MDSIDRQNDQEGVVDTQQDHLGSRQRKAHVVVVGAVILLSCALSVLAHWFVESHWQFVTGYAIITAIWITFVRVVRLRAETTPAVLVVVAVFLMRLPFLFLDPGLSGDVYRYRWDGVVSASGVDPYVEPPDSREHEHLRSDWHSRINHPSIRTIYPPLAQGVFWIWGLTGAGLWLWRLGLLFVDLFIVRALGTQRGFIWATCPFVVIEGFWNGHLELLVAAVLFSSVVALRKNRDTVAGLAAGVAAAIKLTPVVALPALIPAANKRLRFAAAASAILLLPLVPFAVGGDLMPGMSDYATRWEFNGPIYEPIKGLIELSEADEISKNLFTKFKDAFGLEAVSGVMYERLYPAYLARVVCVILLGGLLYHAMRRPVIESRAAWCIAALLVVSPTVHPWYWLVLLPLALETDDWLLVALSIASPLSYIWYESWGNERMLSIVLSWWLPFLGWLVLSHFPGRPDNLSEVHTSK